MENTLQCKITQEDIDRWVGQAYGTACKHGSHDKEFPNAHWLMLIITEISEAVEADRKNIHADPKSVNAIYKEWINAVRNFPKIFEVFIKDTMEDEISDICIRIFDFAGLRNIPLQLDKLLSLESYTVRNKLIDLRTIPICELGYYLTEALAYRDVNLLNKRLESALFAIIIYCRCHNIDLKKHIELKMKYNSLRPYKNGKNY